MAQRCETRFDKANTLSQSIANSKLCVDKLCYGDTVRLSSNNLLGEIAYIGPLHGTEGDWYGISLQHPCGEHNGTFEKHTYFVTKTKHGVLARKNDIENVVQSSTFPVCLSIRDVLYLPLMKRYGRIKYVGYFHRPKKVDQLPYPCNQYVGVELIEEEEHINVGDDTSAGNKQNVHKGLLRHDKHLNLDPQQCRHFQCDKGKVDDITYFDSNSSKTSFIVPFAMFSNCSKHNCPNEKKVPLFSPSLCL
ncbi:hypothetical protein RFI_26462 [Reticulomyxa filosa]|uniref:CAP-Gly domain-containing protein n=1 Tax=Reticulomyxa filosa TaxID=46433 RepID=X6MB97_RETFI|nr:hypothetical protein RFI_26462 [Reticulomyxa filosa]|eukprot:ETO10916.1 hypothetical protein RFI_26462 [Reticulomyxa filosa]